MSKHLYNSKDVAAVRVQLFSEQNGRDDLTGLGLDYKDAVLDHNHRTQFVRGVLHRQVNAALGKIENIWDRYLSTWYKGTLQDFLNEASGYLDNPDDDRFVHPHWLKKSKTEFNKLNSKQKDFVLYQMQVVAISKGYTIKSITGAKFRMNDAKRKDLFAKLLMSRKFTFDNIKQLIEDSKDETNYLG